VELAYWLIACKKLEWMASIELKPSSPHGKPASLHNTSTQVPRGQCLGIL
jgi:hypothetical protein